MIDAVIAPGATYHINQLLWVEGWIIILLRMGDDSVHTLRFLSVTIMVGFLLCFEGFSSGTLVFLPY